MTCLEPTAAAPTAVWATGDAYEPYVGRWSRLVAREFLAWLAAPTDGRWLDVGCGTGALTESILAMATPRDVVGIDPSAGFLASARARVADPRARWVRGDAMALPVDARSLDAVVSGLVLNHVPDPAQTVAEMVWATRPGGLIAAYVWDYAGEMQLMRRFWDAAAALDPAARELDQGRRYPLCQPAALAALFRGAGLGAIETRAIDIPTVFRDFDDYWSPFLGGQGPAPGYAMSLSEDRRTALRERLRADLPTATDGSISLVARAWAVRGSVA